jgi:hypothetical protein
MSIKGALQAVKMNDYGYASIKVSNTWYGGDKKGEITSVKEGDIVEFDNYKNAKNYDTFKTPSLKKIAAKVAGTVVDKGPVASKDEYWSAKETRDLAVEPRINYFAALDRAISFVDLALRNGAIKAYEKAKDTGKLETLSALVYETTQRMIKEAYEQKIPTKSVGAGSSKGDTSPDESDRGSDDDGDPTGDDDTDDGQWS